MNFNRELEVATRLAREAGAALRRYRAGSVEVNYKAHDEPVTPADLQADGIIRGGLGAAFPDDTIYSEEGVDPPGRLLAARVWLVDPLDSTSNFIENGDEYCVSIGLASSGRPVVGVVYNPARDELFAGAEAAGVTLNGVPVHVSAATDLASAHITVSRKEWRRGFQALPGGRPMTPVASMAYKLARVAAGLDDGVVSLKPRKEWGTCAGVALVRAAGGYATLLDGRELTFNRRELAQGRGLVAAGPPIHAALLSQIGQAPT